MTEERLEKIKQDIEVMDTYGGYKDRYLELYNEVVRLRKIIDEANLFIEAYLNNVDDIDVNMQVVKDILKRNNLTLEQLTGVENE